MFTVLGSMLRTSLQVPDDGRDGALPIKRMERNLSEKCVNVLKFILKCLREKKEKERTKSDDFSQVNEF